MNQKHYSMIAILAAGSLCASAQSTTTISNQGAHGKVSVHVSLNGEGTPQYCVTLDADTVIGTSSLGLRTSIGDYSRGLSLANISDEKTVSDSYQLLNAKKLGISYLAKERTFTYNNKDGKPVMEITFHVDEKQNVAFRYRVLEIGESRACLVKDEATSYVFPTDTRTFLCPQMSPQSGFARTAPSYETFYDYAAEMGKNGWGHGYTFPALFEVRHTTPAGSKTPTKTSWVMICETGVDANYCGSRIEQLGSNGYKIAYPEEGEFGGVGSTAPGVMLPGYTPWRTITVGRSLAPMAETTIMWDLVKPLYKASQSYKYGRATWSWIIRMDSSCNFDEQKEYIDFAAELGYEFVLIDAFWDSNIGYERMAELVKYAEAKNVGIFLWYNSNGYWNNAPQGPRGKMHRMIDRRKEMQWLKDTGVKGLKIDFIGSDKQQTMQMYEDILADANDYGLMIIFHGCTLPRGWERMYPNFVSCEAVRASENLSFGQNDNDIEALAATIHPVLRNAVGNMDFGGSALNKHYSRDNQRGRIRRTSDVYALATAILFQTPVQNFALAPNNLTDAPAWAIDFMKAVPTIWEDVRFVDGYPGKYVLMARKSAGKWYFAGVNAQDEPLKTKVDLSMFNGGDVVEIISDDPKLGSGVKTMKLPKNKVINIVIPKDGGIVIRKK